MQSHWKAGAALLGSLILSMAAPASVYAKTQTTQTIDPFPGSVLEMLAPEEELDTAKNPALTIIPPGPAYSEEDLEILAHVLSGECQDYPDEEQRYVGSVVLNRVANSHYPNTISGVVFQRGQYACTKDGNYYRTPTDRNWENAKWLLENGSVLPENVVYQSGGKQGDGVYLHTKYHYYCYD